MSELRQQLVDSVALERARSLADSGLFYEATAAFQYLSKGDAVDRAVAERLRKALAKAEGELTQ